MRRTVLICLLLMGVTLALYWPVLQFDLVYFDDPVVLQDFAPQLQAGLTWPGLKWALTSVVIANWHPVTNLSFLLVSQFFGTVAGPQHLANALIHAANAALLFLVLRRLTGATWQSAVVAAIFAWHPQRVESVAWIIERKDVLCGFFFFLSLFAYAGHAQKPAREPGLPPPRWTRDLALALGAFALALLSKPMAVTLPFVLLLLDIWPLRRFSLGNWSVNTDFRRVVLEKWPFFAFMILFCLATYWIQHDYSAMTPWDKLGLDARLANAISGYVAYLAQLFWPLNLAVIYPYPKSFDSTVITLKLALLVCLSLACLTQLKRRPWLAVGWLWYLGTALPIIGIVQVGEQAMADRYTYLPLIGPVIALVWWLGDLGTRSQIWRIILGSATAMVVLILAILSMRQLQYWQNTISLFEHNVTVAPDNASAVFTLGLGYQHAGDTNRAIVLYRTAKMIEPRDVQNRRALAGSLYQTGHPTAAEKEYWELLAMNPDDSDSHAGLATVLAAEGKDEEYILQLNEAVRSNPDFTEALNNLAWDLTTNPHLELRDGARAVMLAEHACELTHYQKTIYIGTLAAAYAQAGRFDDAIATAQRACDLAQQNGEAALLQSNQALLARYQAHQTAQ